MLNSPILDTHFQVCLITKYLARFATFTFNDRRGLRREKKQITQTKMALNAYARVHGHKNKPEFALAGKCAILRVGVKQNKCFQSVCECGRLYGC